MMNDGMKCFEKLVSSFDSEFWNKEEAIKSFANYLPLLYFLLLDHTV